MLRAGEDCQRWTEPSLPSRVQQTGDVLFLLRLAVPSKTAPLAAAALFYVLREEVARLAGEEAAAALASLTSLPISVGWFDFLLSAGRRAGAGRHGRSPYLSVPW